MSSNEDYVYYIAFKNNLLDCHGDMFQQYFYKVMATKYSNFTKIDCYGNQGDRKCDGYLRGEGIFYQVYGPKDTTSTDSKIQSYAIKKCEEDFLGLLDHVHQGKWEEIKSYIFVINNSRGHFPDLDQKLSELNNKYAPIKFDIMDRDSIISIFNSVDSLNKMSICSCFAPDIDTSIINNLVISKIILYLTNQIPLSNPNKLIAPNFKEKIIWNNINDYYASNLTTANYNVESLNEYLSSYPEPIDDELCAIYNTLYKDAKICFPDDTNSQFQYILDKSFDKSNLSNHEINIYISNAYILLSKYFESCDIFEEPQPEKVAR